MVAAVRGQYADSMHNLRHIMPFRGCDDGAVQNVYWEKSTADAVQMLQHDIGLDLGRECGHLMERFYSSSVISLKTLNVFT